MVVIADVDKFLTKNDFKLLKSSIWPWPITHFVLAEKCRGCGFSTYSAKHKPTHFVVYEKENIKKLLYYGLFWCQHCSVFAIYDHYIDDECIYC